MANGGSCTGTATRWPPMRPAISCGAWPIRRLDVAAEVLDYAGEGRVEQALEGLVLPPQPVFIRRQRDRQCYLADRAGEQVGLGQAQAARDVLGQDAAPLFVAQDRVGLQRRRGQQ